jgi:hypothetical protein
MGGFGTLATWESEEDPESRQKSSRDFTYKCALSQPKSERLWMRPNSLESLYPSGSVSD